MKRLNLPVILLVALGFCTMLPPTEAEARNRIIQRGVCANGVISKLVVSRDRPGIEVEFEIDEAVPDQPWNVVIKHNGRTILRTVARTNADGEFEVETLTANLRGRDRFVATARSGAQSCVLRANVRF